MMAPTPPQTGTPGTPGDSIVVEAVDAPDAVDAAAGQVDAMQPLHLLRRLLPAVLAFTVVMVPNLVAVLTPLEAFPWTSAPMFAHSPVSHDRFVLEFTLVDGKGKRTPFPENRAASLNPWHFRRSFLVSVWGSDDPSTPFGAVDPSLSPSAQKEARRRRLEEFFQTLEAHPRAVHYNVFHGQRSLEVARIQTVADDRVRRGAPATGRRIEMGRYDFGSKRYHWADGSAKQSVDAKIKPKIRRHLPMPTQLRAQKSKPKQGEQGEQGVQP